MPNGQRPTSNSEAITGKLGARQSEVDDFGGSVDSKGEPISNAIRNDEFALAACVKARPITKESGAKSGVFVHHELPAVGVTGESERHRCLRGGVKGMGMMGKEQRECFGVSLLQKLPDRVRDSFIPILPSPRPAEAE